MNYKKIDNKFVRRKVSLNSCNNQSLFNNNIKKLSNSKIIFKYINKYSSPLSKYKIEKALSTNNTEIHINKNSTEYIKHIKVMESFKKNLEKNIALYNEKKKENSNFIKRFDNYNKRKEEKENEIKQISIKKETGSNDIIFKDLIKKYRQKGYKLSPVIYKNNIFQASSLLMENNKIADYLHFSDNKNIFNKELSYLIKVKKNMNLRDIKLINKNESKFIKENTYKNKLSSKNLSLLCNTNYILQEIKENEDYNKMLNKMNNEKTIFLCDNIDNAKNNCNKLNSKVMLINKYNSFNDNSNNNFNPNKYYTKKASNKTTINTANIKKNIDSLKKIKSTNIFSPVNKNNKGLSLTNSIFNTIKNCTYNNTKIKDDEFKINSFSIKDNKTDVSHTSKLLESEYNQLRHDTKYDVSYKVNKYATKNSNHFNKFNNKNFNSQIKFKKILNFDNKSLYASSIKNKVINNNSKAKSNFKLNNNYLNSKISNINNELKKSLIIYKCKKNNSSLINSKQISKINLNISYQEDNLKSNNNSIIHPTKSIINPLEKILNNKSNINTNKSLCNQSKIEHLNILKNNVDKISKLNNSKNNLFFKHKKLLQTSVENQNQKIQTYSIMNNKFSNDKITLSNKKLSMSYNEEDNSNTLVTSFYIDSNNNKKDHIDSIYNDIKNKNYNIEDKYKEYLVLYKQDEYKSLFSNIRTL